MREIRNRARARNRPAPARDHRSHRDRPAPAIDPRRRGIIEVTAIYPRPQSTRAGAGSSKSSRIHPRPRAQRSSAEPYRAHVYAHDALAIGHGGLVRVRGASDDVKRQQVLLARMARACRRPLSGTNVPRSKPRLSSSALWMPALSSSCWTRGARTGSPGAGHQVVPHAEPHAGRPKPQLDERPGAAAVRQVDGGQSLGHLATVRLGAQRGLPGGAAKHLCALRAHFRNRSETRQCGSG